MGRLRLSPRACCACCCCCAQSRLTEYLHKQYCSNRAYYAATTLGGMMHPDQRITEDVEKFAFAISDL